MSLEPTTQFGQYRIIRLLGRGGMGEVYEVEHLTLARRYALKLLPAEFASQPDALARFQREARVMANLEHPHIVHVDDFGETEGRYWLRMELVRGVEEKAEGRRQKAESGMGERCITLGDYAAARGGRIEQAEFALLLRQMLEALACAHEKGIVHRDLKPGNILLEQDAQGRLAVKIADFGLARVVGDEFFRTQVQSSLSRSLSVGQAKTAAEEGSSTRALVGTWEYMSPEQRRGAPADARSDVYAVGLLCYRLLTGKGLGLKLPSELVPGLDAEWDRFVAGAVEQDPAARYANGAEALHAAAAVLRLAESAAGQREGEAERRRTEEERQAAEAAQQRKVEAEQRAAAAAARAREADEQRQRAARQQARRQELERLQAEQRLRAEETRIKMTGALARVQVLLLSPWLVLTLTVLAVGAACYWGIPAYQKRARAKAAQAAAEAAHRRQMEYRKQQNEVAMKRHYESMGFANRQEFEAAQLEVQAAQLKAQEEVIAAKERQLELRKVLRKFAAASPFVNSLGMKFVYASRSNVLFSIWETRVKDYAAYAAANSSIDRSWRKPGFTQNDEHPVVMVNCAEATGFCEWLTQKERAEGKIATNQTYRLPKDTEWTYAAGRIDLMRLARAPTYSESRNQYPGATQPSSAVSGNSMMLPLPRLFQTAPVGQAAANRTGLYDVEGNVREWCLDDSSAAETEAGSSGLSMQYGSRFRSGSSPTRNYPAAPGGYGVQSTYAPPGAGRDMARMHPQSQAGARRTCVCGGSWRAPINFQQTMASWPRDFRSATERQSDIGFRVVLEGKPEP